MLNRNLKELSGAVFVLAFSSVLVLSPDAYLVMLLRAFMPWWALGLLACSMLALWRGGFWLSAAMLIGAVGAYEECSFQSVKKQDLMQGATLHVAHMNVWQPNESYAEVVAFIRHCGADLVSLQEVSPEWAMELCSGLSDMYPFRVIEPRSDCYGIALFSKQPLQRSTVRWITGTNMIEAEVAVGGQAFHVIAAHATSPTGYIDFRSRNEQLAQVAERIRSMEGPVLLIGDLNTVHWDRAYVDLCARSGARPMNPPSELTWPALGPMALMPLDHALIKGAGATGRVDSFRIAGSDHRGLLAEIHVQHAY